ncbi:CheR family methyltransferase [Pseudoduganella namucuonensis]|uniref:Chemotaxis protein methyltransferase WspC n=1 Tax=Pseudoduganella namucuonensis TaxID=1035707 RepID=A0A1I7M6D5_9BURK|nr:protein-glutamate O-methyltransferase CheR [Pseudoduganella namucuonensis]SFV17486.1 chemotaxis protein methyltransferase WspC [Pseudoduganella namucuonensis]
MKAQAMLRRMTGLNLSKAQADRAIRQRMELTRSVDRDAYLAGLTPEELTELVELVVVPESWLFRDAQAFYTAVEFVKARLAASARPVRILSVPCAGGEEPYSMAMALGDAGVAPQCYTIDAYDLSPACVARARAGVYGRNAFRAHDLGFRDRHFTRVGEEDYQISMEIRARVRFSQGNLLTLETGARPNYYDVIFCRNLLIYFDKPTTAAAIARLSALLADDGVLFAGYAEVPSFTQHGYTPLPQRQAFGLRKDAEPPPAAYAALPTPGPAPVAAAVKGKAVAPAPVSKGAGLTRGPAGAPGPAAPGARPAAGAQDGRAAARKAAPASAPSSAPSPARPAAGALLSQARALADRGQDKEAAAACQAALASVPDSAEAYFILGMLSEHARQPVQAEEHWRRCIYLQPDHYDALCHLALLAEQHGDDDAASTLKARAKRIYQRQQGAAKAEP